jgi:NAD(P)-dependent dehydrogenase (short-subunit alcohol dehydrogenase family)
VHVLPILDPATLVWLSTSPFELQVADKARAAGAADVVVVTADMTKREDCEGLAATALQQYGRLDVLLLNHALVDDAMTVEYPTTAELQAGVGSVLAANFMGGVLASHAAMPLLTAAGGHIAIVSSVSAKTPVPFHGAYVASKRALHGYFDTLRHELHLTKRWVGAASFGHAVPAPSTSAPTTSASNCENEQLGASFEH